MIGLRFVPGFRTIGGVAIGMSDVSTGRFIFLNLLGAALWAVVIGILGFLCGHVLELILGEIKRLEGPIFIGIAAVGVLYYFIRRLRRAKAPAAQV
jgi:membrane protein DedA with SNARE-associated domain